jgi:hypothetical protein
MSIVKLSVVMLNGHYADYHLTKCSYVECYHAEYH